MIEVFLGTKAQYIKTAPLLRLMDAQNVAYRLIDSGQHANFSKELRKSLQVREARYRFGVGARYRDRKRGAKVANKIPAYDNFPASHIETRDFFPRFNPLCNSRGYSFYTAVIDYG